MLNEQEEIKFNLDYQLWTNNDGLWTTWLLSVMTDEVITINVGIDNAYYLWKSIEDQLLTGTKEQEHMLKDRLASLRKISLLLKDSNKSAIILQLSTVLVSDTDKVFAFARSLGAECKEFQISMLTKPLFQYFSQFLLALRIHINSLKQKEKQTNMRWTTIKPILAIGVEEEEAVVHGVSTREVVGSLWQQGFINEREHILQLIKSLNLNPKLIVR